MLKKKAIKKVIKGLGKAVKAHTKQAKMLKGAINGGSKKKEREKSLKAPEGDCIQMKILEILYQLSLRPLQMLVKLWQKLNESVNRTQEKSKFLRLVNREPKLWVKQRWLAYLKKVKKQLGKERKRDKTRNTRSS